MRNYLILLIFTIINLNAQTASDSSKTSNGNSGYHVAKFFNYLENDFKSSITAPVDFKTKEWLIATGTVITLGSLFYYDEKISDKIRAQKSKTADLITEFGNSAGEGIVVAPFLASIWLTGHLTENQRMQKTFFYSLETLALSAVFTQVIKYSVGRARPYLDLGSSEFIGLNKKGDYNSFPSGHTQTSFAVASAFALEYSDNYWVVIPAYLIGVTTAFARVRDNKHWASDVFTGATIGYLSAQAVRKAHQNSGDGFSYSLNINKNSSTQFGIAYNF